MSGAHLLAVDPVSLHEAEVSRRRVEGREHHHVVVALEAVQAMRRVGQACGPGLGEEAVAQVRVAHPAERLVADEVAHGRLHLIEHGGVLPLQLAVPVALRPRLLARVEDRDAIPMLVGEVAQILGKALGRLEDDALGREEAVEHRVGHAGRGDQHAREPLEG
ncbi:MAG: hypothetical protein K2X71_00460 [Methylobacterium sp.]|uniref:hypothetical protein n=1 Tax=Methylobacterium sp. TaxID=409 RepID=UPI00258F25BA|nr:hypothetical protein [Methylobacterium sp.]MBY0294508.1 hypothetical protein [Methylobacterium sp.]